MFDNIGGKIKTLAKTLCWIGIVCFFVLGVVVVAINERLLFLGLLIMIVGAFLSWIGSFILYGFGQLIENTDKLVLNTDKPRSDKQSHQTKKVNENTHAEEALTESFQNIKRKNSPEKRKNSPESSVDFLTEIRETSTDDLELILKDQQDLYNATEIRIIKEELASRKMKASTSFSKNIVK